MSFLLLALDDMAVVPILSFTGTVDRGHKPLTFTLTSIAPPANVMYSCNRVIPCCVRPYEAVRHVCSGNTTNSQSLGAGT